MATIPLFFFQEQTYTVVEKHDNKKKFYDCII